MLAIASLKVGKAFWYQLATGTTGARFAYSSLAHSVIRENRSSRNGVVRTIARSDY